MWVISTCTYWAVDNSVGRRADSLGSATVPMVDWNEIRRGGVTVAKSRDKGGREAKKPKKDQAAKVLTRPTSSMPMAVDVVPRKRKPPREEEEE